MREDRDGARVADDLARPARAVGPLDRVDPERQVAAAMEDPRVDDALVEVGPGGSSAPSSAGAVVAQATTAHVRGEGQAALAVEQVELLEREDEVDDVAGSDAVRRVDDGDDVLVGRVDVEQLLVAEVLDDVRPGLERAHALRPASPMSRCSGRKPATSVLPARGVAASR